MHISCTVIHGVTIGGHQADYVQLDPFVNLTLSTPKDCHLHPELKRRVYSSYAEADEGELSIAIPRTVQLVMNTDSVSRSECLHILPLLFYLIRMSRRNTRGPSVVSSTRSSRVYSYYGSHRVQSQRPCGWNTIRGTHRRIPLCESSVQSSLCHSDCPQRIPHAYTTPSSPDAARCWVPCLDNMNDKCTWELQFVVPRQLEEEDEQDETGSYPTVVVCSGDFGEQVSIPFRPVSVF
jgi:transcription initiation factor TFIID subunit 2